MVANAAALLHRGRVAGVYHKILLPNYGVFDEFRYFVSGTEPCVVRLHGIDVANDGSVVIGGTHAGPILFDGEDITNVNTADGADTLYIEGSGGTLNVWAGPLADEFNVRGSGIGSVVTTPTTRIPPPTRNSSAGFALRGPRFGDGLL